MLSRSTPFFTSYFRGSSSFICIYLRQSRKTSRLNMRLRFNLAAACLTVFPLLSFTAVAQTVQSALWRFPDGGLADFSETFTSGFTLGLSWNEFVHPGYIDTTKTRVDLWITSYDINLSDYTELVKANIDLRSPGNIAWTIAIPPSVLDTSAKFVLRFKAHAAKFDIDSPELSSPGILILRAATPAEAASRSSAEAASSSSSSAPTEASSSSRSAPAEASRSSSSAQAEASSSSSATSTPTSSGTTNVISASPTSSTPAISGFSTLTTPPTASATTPTTTPSTPTTTPPPPPTTLSTPAIAGIGAGIAVAFLALLSALGYYLLAARRRRKAKLAKPPPFNDPKDYPYAYPYAEQQPAELPHTDADRKLAELPHTDADTKLAELPHRDAEAKLAELPGRWHVAELPGRWHVAELPGNSPR